MLKKTVKYKDPFTEEEREENLYFHLTQAEVTKLEMSEKGGLSEALKSLIASEDGKEIMRVFEGIIGAAYGKRTPDGRFIKSPEMVKEFLTTEAYSTFFMELILSTDAQIAFIRGLVPADLADEALLASGLAAAAQPKLQEVPPEEVEHITRAQFLDIPAEEIDAFMLRMAKGEVVIDQ